MTTVENASSNSSALAASTETLRTPKRGGCHVDSGI